MPQDRIITSSVNISAVPAASGQTFNSPTIGGVAIFNNTPNLPGFKITSDTPNIKAELGLENVTNESKATMFASPTFTGIAQFSNSPSLPGLGQSSNTPIATFKDGKVRFDNTPQAPGIKLMGGQMLKTPGIDLSVGVLPQSSLGDTITGGNGVIRFNAGPLDCPTDPTSGSTVMLLQKSIGLIGNSHMETLFINPSNYTFFDNPIRVKKIHGGGFPGPGGGTEFNCPGVEFHHSPELPGFKLGSRCTNTPAVAAEIGVGDGFGALQTADKIVHKDDSNTSIRFPLNDTISFETGGLERIKLTPAGNVLIGMSSPTSSVQAALEIGNLSPSNDARVHIVGGGVGSKQTLAFYSNTRGYAFAGITGESTSPSNADTPIKAAGDLYFSTDSGSPHPGGHKERLRIKSTGQIGIGTSSPAGALHVKTQHNTPTFTLTGLQSFADNAAASSLAAGTIYRASGAGSPVAGTLMIKF